MVHRELNKPGVTRILLWQEYLRPAPGRIPLYQFGQLCRKPGSQAPLGRACAGSTQPGAMIKVDYAGMTLPIRIGDTIRTAAVFTACLPYSGYLFAEATWTQAAEDWLASHVRLFADLGGVPGDFVPDNLKTGITHRLGHAPGSRAWNRVDPSMAQQKGSQVLALLAQVRHRGLARPHQLAHRLMAGVRHPDGGQFAGAVQAGQGDGIPAVGLDALARLLGDQRRGDDRAVMPERGDLALQAIAGRTGLVAERQPAILAGELVDQPSYRLWGMVDRAEEAHFALAPLFGQGHGIFSLEISRPTKRYYPAAWLVPYAGGSAPDHPARPSFIA